MMKLAASGAIKMERPNGLASAGAKLKAKTPEAPEVAPMISKVKVVEVFPSAKVPTRSGVAVSVRVSAPPFVPEYGIGN